MNPFEDPDGTYFVLINAEGQYSLWPGFIEIPAGWSVARTGGSRQECLDYVDEHWTDMRPQSLVRQMGSAD